MDYNEMAVNVFDRCAQDYQAKFMDVQQYSRSLDIFCAQVKKDAGILELACGPGNITKYLLQKRPDLEILGTDLAPNMLELAKQHNPQAIFQLMDCRDIGKLEYCLWVMLLC